MLKEVVATGATVEIAFNNACNELGVDTADAAFEIIQMPTKKTFGIFGGSPAKVRAYIHVNEPVQDATAYLEQILSSMGVNDIQISVNEMDAGAEFLIDGDDIGFIIGHRGETLDALQYLTSLVANHSGGNYFKITLDVGNYRVKRKLTLESLGRKMASRAVKTVRNYALEPMNPYERRIIHTSVQTVEGAKSWSEGEDQIRHVVIGPVDGEKRRQSTYNRPRSQNNDSRSRNQNQRSDSRNRTPNQNHYSKPRNNGSTVNRKQISESKKVDDPNTPVYGRLDSKK